MRMIVAAMGAFIAAAAIAAGVTQNYVEKGHQPDLQNMVFLVVVLIGVAFCCLAQHARGPR